MQDTRKLSFFPVNSSILQDEGYPTIWDRHLHRKSVWAFYVSMQNKPGFIWEDARDEQITHFRRILETWTTDCGHAALPSYYSGCRLITTCFRWYPSKPSPTTPLIPRFWRSATCNEPIVEVHGQGGKCPKENLECQICSGPFKLEATTPPPPPQGHLKINPAVPLVFFNWIFIPLLNLPFHPFRARSRSHDLVTTDRIWHPQKNSRTGLKNPKYIH